jgi:LuxR family quorum sensing-dependent transcriptional regulator
MNLKPSNEVLDTVQALQRAPSVLKIKEQLRSIAACRGYDFFFCAAAPSAAGSASETPIVFEDWPIEWTRRYRDEQLFMSDPVVTRLQRTPDPFLWTDAWAGSGTPAQKRVMNEAKSFGMCQGFVVPIFGVGGSVHGISFSGRQPRTDDIARAELHLVAMYAYARAKRLARREPEPPISITLREREAIQWAAAGKTDWEIGEVLGISESAAHKRIESAKRKYRVATRVQAIVEALRHGHIQI